MNNETSRHGITLRELFFVVVIIGVLAAIAIPNFKAARERDNYPRSCYATQKTIVGAMEMYNLDKNTKRTHLDEPFFVALKSGGYLQSIPNDLGGGPGSWRNFHATTDGNGITCEAHGPIAMPEGYRKK